MKLGNIVKLEAGINRSRINEYASDNCFYTVVSIENDLNQSECQERFTELNGQLMAFSGDVVVGMVAGRAAVVSMANSGKALTSNFVKCSFDKTIIDPWFLVFWFNESDEVKLQNHMNTGRALYSPSAISSLEITLPRIDLQQRIGRIYKDVCRKSYLLEREKTIWEKLVLGEIKKVN